MAAGDIDDFSAGIFSSNTSLNPVVAGKIPILKDIKTEEQLKILFFPYMGGIRYEGYSKILQQDIIDLINKKLVIAQTPWQYHIATGGASVTTPTWTGKLYLTRIDFSSTAARTTLQINTGGAGTLVWSCLAHSVLMGSYEFNPPLLMPEDVAAAFQMVVTIINGAGASTDLRIRGWTE